MIEFYCESCHRVFLAKEGSCCGKVVPFEATTHGRSLVSSSNAWITVWNRWKDHPLIRSVADEWAKDGNYSCAGILNDAFERMSNDV